MSELDSKELYDSAIADTPVETKTETPVEPKVEVSNDAPARDEQGRFAQKEAKADAPVETPAPPAQPDNAAHVPSWRLREVNEAREAAERRAQDNETRAQTLERHLSEMQRQMQALQPKPEPIDFYADPSAAFKQQLSPVEAQLQTLQSALTLRASKAEAIADHGRAAVVEMEKAIGQAMREGHPDIRALAVQMNQSDDPVGVAMNWYQRDKLLKETGGDLSAYKNKTLEDALKDPAFLAKAIEAVKAQAGGTAQTLVQLPPSINRATSAASPHEAQGDMSDRSLYAQSMR